MKKTLFFTLVFILGCTVTYSQNKKAEKEAEAKKLYEKALTAIEAKEFVVIVDTYEASSGTYETNTDIANFFSYEKEFVYLQGTMVAGSKNPNKMSVSDYSKEVDKKGNVSISMQLKGSLLTAKAEIYMKKNGNYADFIITTTNQGTKRFSGEVIPLAESKYFKRPSEI